MECAPVDKMLVETEYSPAINSPEPSSVFPSLTVTVPVGNPDPAALGCTVVVNVTLSP